MSTSTDFAFLHGGGQGGWVWSTTIAALELQSGGNPIRTLALDVPGCGAKRGRDTSAIDMDGIADELLADLDAAGMRKVVLTGHSQAGTVLPRMAEKRPELFHRLVYASCSIPLPGQTVLQMIGKGVHGSHADEVGWPFERKLAAPGDRYRDMFCNDMSQTQSTELMARLGKDNWPMSSYAATDWRHDHLDKIPSTYIACLRDGILPMEWQRKFAARFKVQRIVEVDAGHQLMLTRPHTLAEILRDEAQTDTRSPPEK